MSQNLQSKSRPGKLLKLERERSRDPILCETRTFTNLFTKPSLCFRMERVKHTKSKPADIDSEIPSAPTLEDFYFDPGIAGQESPTFQDPLGVHQISAPPLPGIQNLDISAESKHLTPIFKL